MTAIQQNGLILSQADYERLLAVIDNHPSAAADALDEELSRAAVVAPAELPADVVTMDTKVTFEDLDSGAQSTVTLVYPALADVATMRISVLSPVGSALIGLRVGGVIDWPLPSAKIRRLKVVAVEQPAVEPPDA